MSKKFNIQNSDFAAYYFNDTEEEIVSTLAKHPEGLAMKALSGYTKKTRLTLLHSLNKLLTRGCVEKDEHRKAHIWKWKENRQNLPHTVQEMTVEEAYAFLTKHTRTKIYAIQGSQATEDEIERWEYKMSSLAKAHTSQKLKSTVIEALASEDILPLLRKLSPEQKKSHFGRATSARLLPQGTLSVPYELLFTTSFVCCLYPKENSAVLFNHKPLAQMLVALYPLLCTNAKKFNLGEVYKTD